MDNDGIIAQHSGEAFSDMDFIDSILSACSVKASKRQSVKVPIAKNKMEDCSVCPDASRKHCFDCMNDFYNHMHDPTTMGRLFMPQRQDDRAVVQ